MRTFTTSLVLACLVALTGGAAAPDIVFPGQRYVTKDMRVDPGKLAKTHFVFVLQDTKIIEVTKETAIRAYLFQTRIYAVPLAQKAEAKAAVAKLNQVTRIWPRPGQPPRLPNIPFSKLLETRETVSEGNPIHTIEIRYKVTGVERGKLVVNKTRRMLDKKGNELKQGQLKQARQHYAALLGVVGALGVVGLGFVASRRDRAEA